MDSADRDALTEHYRKALSRVNGHIGISPTDPTLREIRREVEEAFALEAGWTGGLAEAARVQDTTEREGGGTVADYFRRRAAEHLAATPQPHQGDGEEAKTRWLKEAAEEREALITRAEKAESELAQLEEEIDKARDFAEKHPEKIAALSGDGEEGGVTAAPKYPPAERLVESLRWAVGFIDRRGPFKADPDQAKGEPGPADADWIEWASAHDWLKDAEMAATPDLSEQGEAGK